ncbi:hypothetical protein PaeCFBP13512_14730 [Paenibacillus sp. CFBP13512]|nr:hypothetical protein PaeCFBP13512_14730 [Paenibacillus sp. CFBP13512]
MGYMLKVRSVKGIVLPIAVVAGFFEQPLQRSKSVYKGERFASYVRFLSLRSEHGDTLIIVHWGGQGGTFKSNRENNYIKNSKHIMKE